MPNFLSQTAAAILRDYSDLQNIGIILPSRRAAVFLKKELSQHITKPVWSPYINTIEDFLLQNLNWEQADQPTLVFSLYESYVQVAHKPHESFAEFSQWAHLLLADFNEIDRYLVDAKSLFSYLADVERIKKWDLKPEGELTDFVKNYLHLWEMLPELYEAFTQKLRTTGKVYQGMAYREMALALDQKIALVGEKFHKLIFVGFNALNTAEEKIFSSLYHEGLADFYWDVDNYYFEDKNQEAGSFLRKSKLVKELIEKKDFKWKHDSLSTTPKNIQIINVGGRHLQGMAANAAVLDFMEQTTTPVEPQEMAVVLADEELLPVFLNNLAQDIGSLNITMGLPLHITPVAGFFQLLLDMFQEFEYTQRKDRNKNPAFHFQKWDDLLSHPFFRTWAEDVLLIEDLRQQIREQNRIFISANDLSHWSKGKLKAKVLGFFNRTAGSPLKEFWQQFAILAEDLHMLRQNKDSILQALFGFFKLYNRLSALMAEYPYVKDLKTGVRFYRDLVRSESLDLYGEPLSGLQVMGMLETRTLDFKKLIITSLNEDILPQGRSENSLVPFDIKREFGLPTYLEKDAVFAYHFYRLLQRAEDVVLIYNGISEGLGSGEPSRFIRQLELELGRANRQVSFTHRNPAFQVEPETKVDEIAKTPSIMKRLEEMAQKGFSPTALIDYVNDPLEFYKKRVLGLKEADEVEEVAGYDTQGNAVHHLLEKFYSREIDGKLKAKSVLMSSDPVFEQNEADIRRQVVDWLTSEAHVNDLDTGKNLLIREILTGMVVNFLRKEKEELQKLESEGLQLSLLGLEQNIKSSIQLEDGRKIVLKGVIDRIDRIGNEVRIIDYKTGFVEDKNVKISEMAELRQPKDKNKSIQLLMYAWLCFQEYPHWTVVQPAIISLRNVNAWQMKFRFEKKEGVSREEIKGFEDFLKSVLQEIFDPGIPFSKKLLTLELDE